MFEDEAINLDTLTSYDGLAQFDLGLDSADDLDESMKAFEPPPPLTFGRWCIDQIVNDQGRHYDFAAYPHITAPGGPADAADDVHVRTISLQFATRLAKSFFGQCYLLYRADSNPCPMMLASSSERSLKKKVMHRLYKMVYQMPLREKLLYKSQREHSSDLMEFKQSQIVGAWGRSPDTLGDENIMCGVANEIDKPGWNKPTTSKEAEPLKLFDERFKDFMSVRKVIYESTPTIKGASRIEGRLLTGTNCRLHVPCPHCKRYQELRMGARDQEGKIDITQPGRLAFDTPESGKPDKDLAKETAHYVCISGKCKPILDEHRAWMMRRGVWVPEGCKVRHKKALAAAEHWYEHLTADAGGDGASLDPPWKGWKKADWISGKPARDAEDASYQLSSLYALSLSWGDIAKEFVTVKDKPAELHNFINSWLGESFEIRRRKQDWEALGRRLIEPEISRMIVPEWASIVTTTVDRQEEFYVWQSMAWGPGRRAATIGYGDADTLDEIRVEAIERHFVHADGGKALRPAVTLIDDGFKPDSNVYDFCMACNRAGMLVLPCKGSSKVLDANYKQTRLGKNTSNPGQLLIFVDTMRTQAWIDNVLHSVDRTAPGGLSLHEGTLEEHQDWLQQVLNDTASLELDRDNNQRERWMRIDTHVPNDYRDLTRYGFVAMLIASRGGNIRPRNAPPPKHNAVINPGSQRPKNRW